MADWTDPVGWLTEKLIRPKRKNEIPKLRETMKKAKTDGWADIKNIIEKRKREQEKLLDETK